MSDAVSERNAEHYMWGGDCEGWHLLKTPGLSVIKERMPAGREEVRHYHDRSHQFFYILSGQAILEMEGRDHRIKADEGFSVPPGAAHKLRNAEAEDLVFVLVSSPMSHGDRIELEPAAR